MWRGPAHGPAHARALPVPGPKTCPGASKCPGAQRAKPGSKGAPSQATGPGACPSHNLELRVRVRLSRVSGSCSPLRLCSPPPTSYTASTSFKSPVRLGTTPTSALRASGSLITATSPALFYAGLGTEGAGEGEETGPIQKNEPLLPEGSSMTVMKSSNRPKVQSVQELLQHSHNL